MIVLEPISDFLSTNLFEVIEFEVIVLNLELLLLIKLRILYLFVIVFMLYKSK